MTIKKRYMLEITSNTNPNRIADRMHIVLHAAHNLEVHDTSMSIFD